MRTERSKVTMNVGVIFGGRSAEHEVSIMSAQYVADMLARLGHRVVLMAIDRWGRWWFDDVAHAMLEQGSQVIPPPDAPPGPEERIPPVARLAAVDIVFPALHGPFGEDGTIQGMFELAGIPYVGSGVTGSAVGMDKAVAKQVFRAAGLPVLPYLVLYRDIVERQPAAAVAHVESMLTYPVFVKPANLGSSVGITKVESSDTLVEAMREASRYDVKILVEQGIPAREIEVSVLGNTHPETSVVGEVVPGKEWYDYEAKYEHEATQLLIPADISSDQAAAVQEMARRAFLAVDAAGLARVDFLMHKETGELFINELNTMPGFTRMSMYPRLWAASGLTGEDLVARLIELGLQRHAERRELAA